jgi:hypothetical protein
MSALKITMKCCNGDWEHNMVRVVKTEPAPSVVKEVVCRNCGVTLEYVPNDVKSEIHRNYGGESYRYDYIQCPACANKVGVR